MPRQQALSVQSRQENVNDRMAYIRMGFFLAKDCGRHAKFMFELIADVLQWNYYCDMRRLEIFVLGNLR